MNITCSHNVQCSEQSILWCSDLKRLHCSVRKEADAKRLQAEFGDFFTPLLFDVTDEQAVNRAAAEVRSRMKGHYLMGLVNNAGDILRSPDFQISIYNLHQLGALYVSQSQICIQMHILSAHLLQACYSTWNVRFSC